ncbi:MAG: TIGR03936 family radical SAM-associated protein [Coriobacteriales bacterium]|nr:TIGR03936 family radical SAM-associated protein [Coriobacteriales bacterium]
MGEPCRMRVRYVKDGRLAYLGHLEVMNTIMRCVRRSGLPFEVGNGFARRMRIQFSQALPVGASSAGEYYDLMLPHPVDVTQALAQLREATPSALQPNACKLLPRKVPALEAWVNVSRWDAVVQADGVDADVFAQGVERVVAQDVIEYMRGPKLRRIQVSPTLMSCHATDTSEGVALSIQTRTTEAGALRPAVLVQAAVGCVPLRVCRVGQWHEQEDGSRLDPMGSMWG